MNTTGRKPLRTLISFAVLSMLLILPEPAARADELPQGHCSVRVSFSDMGQYLDGQVWSVLESFGVGLNGPVVYEGSVLEVDLLGLNSGTSNDDLLKLTLNIGVPVVGQKHLYAYFYLYRC